jgi:hypothetical protein
VIDKTAVLELRLAVRYPLWTLDDRLCTRFVRALQNQVELSPPLAKTIHFPNETAIDMTFGFM